MTNIEQIQNRILEKMQEILSNEEIQKLENVMAIEFHGIDSRSVLSWLLPRATGKRFFEPLLQANV